MPTATTIDEKIRILTSFRDEDSVIRTMCEGDDAVNSEYSETIETINELNKGSGIEEFDNWLGEVSIEIDLELIQTVEEAEKELDEIKSYYERAKSEFFEYASIFEWKVASRFEYPKHYPLKSEKCVDIKKRTEQDDSPSLFYPGITDKELDWVLILIMDDAFWELAKKETYRMAVDCICVVGASKGEDTDHIYFEFNRSSKIAHAYPVLKREIPDNILVANCDSLQGWAKIDAC